MATEQVSIAARGPRDDTEEDLVGTDWHQDAIRGLRTGLRDLALRAGLPWHVGDQLTLVAWGPYRAPWRPSPDIMVHPTAGAAQGDGHAHRWPACPHHRGRERIDVA